MTPGELKSLLLDLCICGDLKGVKILTSCHNVDPRLKKNKAMRLAIEYGRVNVIDYFVEIMNTERKWDYYRSLAKGFGQKEVYDYFDWLIKQDDDNWILLYEELLDDKNKMWP